MAPEEPAVKGLGVLLLTEEGGPRPQEVREEATLGRGGVLLGLPRRQAHTRSRLREGPLTVPPGACHGQLGRGHRTPHTGGSWVYVSQLWSPEARGQGASVVGSGDAPPRLCGWPPPHFTLTRQRTDGKQLLILMGVLILLGHESPP